MQSAHFLFAYSAIWKRLWLRTYRRSKVQALITSYSRTEIQDVAGRASFKQVGPIAPDWVLCLRGPVLGYSSLITYTVLDNTLQGTFLKNSKQKIIVIFFNETISQTGKQGVL